MLPLFIVLGIIALFIVVVATRPSAFKIERSLAMSAPREVVFEQVNDFHNWSRWSPWAKLDPHMKVTHSGDPSGAGAVYEWAGNRKAGKGRMEIAQSQPYECIKIILDFLEPIRATNVTEFRFASHGRETQVTWCMAGKRNFGMKAFDLLMNMDKMVGGDFEKGLTRLKEISEAETSSSQEPALTSAGRA